MHLEEHFELPFEKKPQIVKGSCNCSLNTSKIVCCLGVVNYSGIQKIIIINSRNIVKRKIRHKSSLSIKTQK